jgi:DNA-binding NarL/FixJ family response regulator
MIRIVVADDQPMFREMLVYSLETCEDFTVVGMASHGLEAVELCALHHPHIVLMDIKMDGCDGIEGTKIIKERFPEIKVLMLTTFDDGEYVSQAIKAGIDGYIVKNANIQELYRAIADTCSGLKVFDRNAFQAIANHYQQELPETPETDSHGILEKEGHCSLNDSELEILRLMTLGMSTAEIANNLYLSSGTVYNYISRMMTRLGLKDRVQLVAFALRRGIVK